jgi:pimeloyl-ACP methyl ester carboxylesterase
MQWMPTARKLLANYHIVMVDLPGHGDSPMPDPFSFEAAARMLDPVLAKLNPDSTLLVGHGVGGLLGFFAVKQHPERQRGLMVLEGGLKSPVPIPDQMKQGFIERLDANYDEILKQMTEKMGRDSVQRLELYARASLVPSVSIKAYMRHLLYVDQTSAAASIRLPMMFVASSKTWPDTVAWNTVAKEKGWDGVPGLETRRIANSGYLMMADQPDSLAAVITEFAKRVMAKK